MDIAILGGTGDIGQGLALRLALDTNHTIRIGSRDAEKADRAAADYRALLAERGSDVALEAAVNTEAVHGGDIVILAAPPYHVRNLSETVADQLQEGAIVVTPAVGMQQQDAGFRYNRPAAGSVTELVADTVPDHAHVVGAYHNLAANRLSNLDADLGIDTLVVADDPTAKATIMEVTNAIDGLRALDAGNLANAPEIEAITPLLINIAKQNDGLHDLGVRFV